MLYLHFFGTSETFFKFDSDQLEELSFANLLVVIRKKITLQTKARIFLIKKEFCHFYTRIDI